MRLRAPGSTTAHYRLVNGRGGAAVDASGRWTWWHLSTEGRRVAASNEADALAALLRAAGGAR